MRYFTKEWYREMQVSGFLVLPETREEWEEELAFYQEEGIDYQSRFQQNLEEMKEDLLKFLPKSFHKYIHNGTLNSKYPSAELRNLVDKWQEDYENRMNQLWAEYNEYYESTKHELPKSAINLVENSLHDAVILSTEMLPHDTFTMTLDCSGGFHYFTKVKLRFTGVSHIQIEQELNGAYWLYDEIYPKDEGFELCILLDSPLSELKIVARDVLIDDIN